MDFKKEIEKLLLKLKNAGIDRRKIELDLHYKAFYIDQIISKGGNKKFYDRLNEYYTKGIEKSNINTDERMAALEAMVRALKHIVAEHQADLKKISFAEASLQVERVLQSAAIQDATGGG